MLELTRRALDMSGTKPEQHPEGRTCGERGCSTRLGSYNPGPNCYLHAPRRFPRVRGKKTTS